MPLIYDFIRVLYNNKGMLIVRRNDKMGVINLSNKELIQLRYDIIEPKELKGVFKCKLNGVWEITKI